jgi:hypothetical protein
MALLSAVVGVLAVVTALNLLVTLALVRRLRGIEARAGSTAGPALPAPGLPVGDFIETAIGGESVNTAALGTEALVAFLSPGCDPCRTVADAMLTRRDRLPETVIALLAGDPDDAAAVAFATDLGVVATVAFIEVSGPAAKAFGGIRDFPTLVRVEHGVVAAAGHDLDDLVVAEVAGALVDAS